MATVVKARIVRIGNSQGIRIPKLLLDQSKLGEDVELEVEQGRIVIRSSQAVREGWDNQFRLMADVEDDKLLDGEINATTWDEEEWEW
ncbi:MAG: AbrB/MazE/SpoVT family DNA-binding domain-containing protein [Chloroflexi bacterium]|nr:AbrB/MazE/SpoVT family DNA-binding domain-containing protein [Chloroflexota bacterium]